jgi:hypothetical protein
MTQTVIDIEGDAWGESVDSKCQTPPGSSAGKADHTIRESSAPGDPVENIIHPVKIPICPINISGGLF